jgi:predicted Zn-dependent protease
MALAVGVSLLAAGVAMRGAPVAVGTARAQTATGQTDSGNGGAAVTVTDAEEMRIGQVLADKFALNQGIAPTPESLYIETYLQKLGEKVAANAGRRPAYHFRFDPNPRFNSAVGLPGGQIFVGAGILAYVDSEDQLAIVLGHEIAHVSLNHCRERIEQILAEQHLAATDAARLKIEDFVAGYGNDQEQAADREGVRLAIAAGYNANAGVRLLQMFVILGQQRPHTATEREQSIEDRIKQMQALAKAQSAPPAETPLGLR